MAGDSSLHLAAGDGPDGWHRSAATVSLRLQELPLLRHSLPLLTQAEHHLSGS